MSFVSTRLFALAAAAAGLATSVPALGQLPAQPQGLVSSPLGGPQAGMVCRSGYNGSIASSAFKCTKQRFHTINLTCTRSGFPNYVIRPASATGTPAGRDVCTRNGVNLGSTDPIGNLVQGQDWVLADVDSARLNTEIEELDRQEAAALGLEAGGVDTTASAPLIQPDAGTGSRDRAVVQVTHYTFAIKTGPLVSAARN